MQAKASVDQLHGVVHKYYQEMSTRLQALEQRDSQDSNHAVSLMHDNDSMIGSASCGEPQSHTESYIEIPSENNALGPDFLDELKRSWVYSRNSAFRLSTFSVSQRSMAWSCISGLSLSEVSNISVFNLAVTVEELNNPQRQSQTWSNDQTVPVWPPHFGVQSIDTANISGFKFPWHTKTTSTIVGHPDDETSSIVTVKAESLIKDVNVASDASNAGLVSADVNAEALLVPDSEIQSISADDAYPCKSCGKVGCSRMPIYF